MRLVAIAPGANRQMALDALVNGGTSVVGTSGSTWFPLPPSPKFGLRIATQQAGSTTWRATVRFPHSGKWWLVVPNWCAPGYASPLAAVRLITVR